MADYAQKDFETCMAMANLTLTTGEIERISTQLLELADLDDLVDGTKQIRSVRDTSNPESLSPVLSTPMTGLSPQAPRIRNRSSQAG